MTTTVLHPVDATLSGDLEPMALELVRHHRIVVTRPVIHQPEYAPFPTAVGSALAVPAPWTQDLHPASFIVAAIHCALTLDEPVVFFVGHTRPGEAPALGKARTEALRCLLANDASPWVDLATAHGSIRDVKAYLQYLNAMLGWECHVAAVDDTVDEPTHDAVEAFQRQYNAEFQGDILEDGVCGTETLGAVFEVMRFEWERWLHKHDLDPATVDALDIRYLDASNTDRSLRGMSALDGEHGLDALVVEKAALGSTEPTPALLYGSSIARHEEYAVTVEPWAWERGPYTIVTDLFRDEPVPKERYTLRSMDGEFETTLTMPDDAVDSGVLELRFLAVPCDKSYELTVQVHDAERYTLFSDVPYNKLHKLAISDATEQPTQERR